MSKKSMPKQSSKKKTPVLAAKPEEGALPTAADAAFLQQTPARDTQTKPQPYDLAFLFDAGAIAVLQSPAVVGFFGEQLQVESLGQDAAQASMAAAVHQRLQNGVQAVGLVYAPPGKALNDRLGLMMNRWEAFSAAHPQEARALTGFKTY